MQASLKILVFTVALIASFSSAKAAQITNHYGQDLKLTFFYGTQNFSAGIIRSDEQPLTVNLTDVIRQARKSFAYPRVPASIVLQGRTLDGGSENPPLACLATHVSKMTDAELLNKHLKIDIQKNPDIPNIAKCVISN